LEEDLAVARDCVHQLREGETATLRLLQQRHDDFERASRWLLLLQPTCFWFMLLRQLVETEERLAAATAALAASESSCALQVKALQRMESDFAAVQARVRELETLSQHQTSLLHSRVQSESQLEEAVKQLQQVLSSL
jgi:hypothetical protein